ncbi:hypothetical protein PQX77_019891 [Marasmius sp. AFHP31]|nr:hypothetical protein PQX77_019891 [Marasmius sp. AFHP31]
MKYDGVPLSSLIFSFGALRRPHLHFGFTSLLRRSQRFPLRSLSQDRRQTAQASGKDYRTPIMTSTPINLKLSSNVSRNASFSLINTPPPNTVPSPEVDRTSHTPRPILVSGPKGKPKGRLPKAAPPNALNVQKDKDRDKLKGQEKVICQNAASPAPAPIATIAPAPTPAPTKPPKPLTKEPKDRVSSPLPDEVLAIEEDRPTRESSWISLELTNVNSELLSFVLLGAGARQHDMGKSIQGFTSALGTSCHACDAFLEQDPPQRSDEPTRVGTVASNQECYRCQPCILRIPLHRQCRYNRRQVLHNHLISAMNHDEKLLGACSKTELANAEQSIITMMEVYEYFISHHMAKGPEPLRISHLSSWFFHALPSSYPDTHKPPLISKQPATVVYGCPCKIITASKPCSNLVHAVDPADQHHWHRHPENRNWRLCELHTCPHVDPLNSIPQARQFSDGSELVPLPFPSPTPAPEPEADLTASAALLFIAPPTPVGSGPATPRPLSALSHRSPSPAETTDSHTSQTTTSSISSMSTQATASTTLGSLLTHLVNQQQSQQAQMDAIRDTFKANKDEGAVIAKPAAFKGDVDDVARFLPMFRNWATEQKALRIKAGPGVPPADVGKLDHRRTIQSALSFCERAKAALHDTYLIVNVALWHLYSEVHGWGFLLPSNCSCRPTLLDNYRLKTLSGQTTGRSIPLSLATPIPWQTYFIIKTPPPRIPLLCSPYFLHVSC